MQGLPFPIITYQVITGNYSKISDKEKETYYNIPSNNRELQQMYHTVLFVRHYNIPSNNRELQLTTSS